MLKNTCFLDKNTRSYPVQQCFTGWDLVFHKIGPFRKTNASILTVAGWQVVWCDRPGLEVASHDTAWNDKRAAAAVQTLQLK